MDCPRCGVSVFSDHSSCRSCGWQLARAFAGAASSSFSSSGEMQTFVSAPESRKSQPAPAMQTVADAFALWPPARSQRVHRTRRRRSAGSGGEGVAVLPPEARWESPARVEVIEMPLVQSAFDFSAAEQEADPVLRDAIAPVGVRAQAGLLDATLIVLASAVFFSLFALLSGAVSLARRDLLIYLVAAFTLAVLYFGLFTLFGGRTPGMQYYGLRPVSFEGKPLAPPQALRRAFGYGVSTGALLLGFFWALVDERRLTWHDRISESFLTDRSVL